MGLALRTILVAVPLVIAAGLVRPRPEKNVVNTGVNRDAFWAERARVVGSLDVVLAGDSRVSRGLAPEEMRAALPDARIGNVAFSSMCLCGAYLPFVEHALDPTSRAPMIVLGVTAHSLTPDAARDNGYVAELRRPRTEVLERIWFSGLLDFTAPYSLDEALKPKERQPMRYFQVFHADGWVASRLEPEDQAHALVEYQRVFSRTHVTPEIESELVSAIAAWHAKNIRVVAFRPPSSPAMKTLEDDVSGFREDDLRARIVAAGATWLTFEDAKYESYDGSHLREDAARALSHDLAEKLAQK